MHGRIKTRTTEEQRKIARQEKLKKAKTYRESMNILLEKRSSSCFDQDALDISASVLTSNPDIITLWNYRREIILHSKDKDDVQSYQELLEKDLNLTEQCLKVNPKSYGSWHHRIWVLNNLPRPNWEKELMLCTKYLQLDERNFHCWDYRRIVTQKFNVSDESEYKFTLEKIESNFSNYSAWHLRSKLLPKIFPDREGKLPIDEIKHKEELELVENAAFTDPNDQSAWFYQRWLLNLTEPKISFIYIERGNEEIFVITSRSLKLDKESFIGVKMVIKVKNVIINGVWKSPCTPSCLWTFTSKTQIQSSDTVIISLLQDGTEYSTELIELNKPIQNEPKFYPTFSNSLLGTLTNQLSSCKQLIELEPDSKWTLLTSIFLMCVIDSTKNQREIMEGLKKLCEIDPLRRGYYLDLMSKTFMQFALTDNFNHSEKFILSNQNLSSIYHSQYLHAFKEVDLSCNLLTSSSLKQLYALRNCKILNLSGNKIVSLYAFPILSKLETLLLDNNLIEDIDENFLRKILGLKHLSLKNNPMNLENLCDELLNVSFKEREQVLLNKKSSK